jgi:hypothetical protein
MIISFPLFVVWYSLFLVIRLLLGWDLGIPGHIIAALIIALLSWIIGVRLEKKINNE